MLEEIKLVIELLSAMITILLFLKKPLKRGLCKLRRVLRIGDIYITISFDKNNGSFILEKEKSSSLDYMVWYEKIKKGNKIIVNCKYRAMLEKAIKKTNNETTERIYIDENYDSFVKKMINCVEKCKEEKLTDFETVKKIASFFNK